MSRQEKKEQKLCKKWEKQGFSELEIKKLLESQHKKTKIKKIVSGLVVGALTAAAVVCAVVPQIRNSLINLIKNIKNDETEQKTQKEKENEEIEKLISDSDSNNAKEELDKKTDREKSEDIIIPNEATEEEKKQLKEKKLYLQVVENVSRIYTKAYKLKFPDDDSTMIGIKNLYKTDTGYAFYVNAVNKAGNKYYISNSLISINCEECKTFEELNENLNNQSKATLLQTFNSYSKCEDLNKELFRLFSNQYDKTSDFDLKLIDTTTDIKLGSNDAPINSVIFYSMEYQGQIKYFVSNTNYLNYSLGSTYDELVKFLQAKEGSRTFDETMYTFSESNLNWNLLCENMKTEEQKAEEVVESNLTRDENGKVTGMAWGSIQTQREEEKAEREARLAMADTSSNVNVLYSDQGLSL